MGYTQCQFSGQGIVYAADRLSTGKPDKLQDLGNVTSFKANLKNEVMKTKESRSGFRLPSNRISKGFECEISLTTEDLNVDNLCLGLYGSMVTKAAGSVTGEVLPSGLIALDRVQLANPKVTSVVVHDSAGTPALVALTTNYTVDPDPGHLVIVDPGAFTQPFKADYSYAASKKVGAFTVPPSEKMLILEGINTADEYRRVRITVFRVKLDPFSDLDFINDEIAKLPMKGDALADPLRLTTDPLGQFLSYEYLDA